MSDLGGNRARRAGASVGGANGVRSTGRAVLSPPRELLANHSPKRLFQVSFVGVDVVAQRRIDQCLIAGSTLVVSRASEPCQDVVVDSDGDSCLAGRCRDRSAPLTSAEIVFRLHEPALYCSRSRRVALRAEIRRATLPRQVKTTTRIRPGASMPSDHEPVLDRVAITKRQRLLVVQRRRGVSEIDAVLAQIRRRLPTVPFELHLASVYARLCTTAMLRNGRPVIRDQRPDRISPRGDSTAQRRRGRHAPGGTCQQSPESASIWTGRRPQPVGGQGWASSDKCPVWTGVRGAVVQAGSPAKRGRSEATHLDGGEHTPKLSVGRCPGHHNLLGSVPGSNRSLSRVRQQNTI